MKKNIENEVYYGTFSIGHKSDDSEEVSTEALRQSYTEGNLDAGNKLALRLQKGRLCKANPEEALNIFRVLAQKGHLMGIYNYAEALESGRGTAQNLDEAKKWYDIAIDRGLPAAMANQAFLLTFGPKDLQDYQRGYELALDASVLGEEEAMYLLGLFHITDKYGCKDEFRAFECFRKAVDMGASAFAYRWISICYEKGLGVEQDDVMAEEWTRKAIERGLPHKLVRDKYRHLLSSDHNGFKPSLQKIPIDDMCQNYKLILHKKIMIMKKNNGHIKVVVCRKPEERRTIVQKDILQQMEQKPVPSLIFCNNGELSEWTKGLIKAADITPGAYSPEKAKEITEKMDAIAKLPLYLFEEKSFDIGWISWKLYSNIEKLGIRKIYIENLSAFDIVDPFDEEFVNASQEPIPEDLANELKKALGDLYTDKPFGKEDSEKSLKAQHIPMVVEILRHIVDQYGIELTIVMDNELCNIPKVESYPDVLTNPYHINDFVDEIVIAKETL